MSSKIFSIPRLTQISNLTLIVSPPESQQTFKVTIDTLQLASDVFNAMLDPQGPFLENGAGQVSLPDDDADAFEIMLAILYHQNVSQTVIPAKAVLWQLELLADKYAVVEMVQPHFHQWAAKGLLDLHPEDILHTPLQAEKVARIA